MDDVLQNDFSPSSIRKINLCRPFLQVESLAEICNTTRNSILVSVWKGQRPASKSRSLWPRQARPHEPSWQLWRRFVRLVYLHPSRQTANYAMNRSWDNPNHCLSSECDVESGIVDILNRLPFKLACLHVKGHQDDDAPVAELPWEAQMNCHANAHATDYLNNWSAPSKVVPFIPASQASISLAGVTLTRNVVRWLRQAASSPALAQHIMTANGWNAWILNSIAWDSQSKALGTLEHTQEIFVTKWAHNLLPTRRHSPICAPLVCQPSKPHHTSSPVPKEFPGRWHFSTPFVNCSPNSTPNQTSKRFS
jgi:hypothetical protein